MSLSDTNILKMMRRCLCGQLKERNMSFFNKYIYIYIKNKVFNNNYTFVIFN